MADAVAVVDAMPSAVKVPLPSHPVLEVVQKLLLRADDAPRAADAAQGYALRGGIAEVFHHEQGDVCPGTPETGFAVDGNNTLLFT